MDYSSVVDIRSQLRNFWRALRSDDGPVKRVRHSGHSLAKALGDASAVSGAGGGAVGTNSAAEEAAAEAHERYNDSFDN